jgi:phenylacetate-CoA ligase
MQNGKAFQQRIHDFLSESQYWPLSDIARHQQNQLEQLLRFAKAHVPFYKTRLDPVFSANGAFDFSQWKCLPILTRKDLLIHREAMLADELPPGHGPTADTEGSGTTGAPVTTRHNALVHHGSQAALYRAYDWHTVDYGGVFVQWMGNDEAVAAWPDGLAKGPWGPPWNANAAKGQFWQINRKATPEQVAEFASRKRADYLSGRPKSLHSVALAAERSGFSLPLSHVSTFSTATTAEERDDFKRIFGADTISLYASKEVYNIAHQCPTENHFHVNHELLLLEVVDEDGNDVPPGTRGRTVVTSFYNTAQPFIRYDLGDQIILSDKPCGCGRTLPVIASIEGRTTHLFRFPDGRKIAPSIPPEFRSMIGAVTWQLAQVGPLALELRYLPDGSSHKPDFEGFTHIIRQRTDPQVSVTYKSVSVLPLTPSGKFIEYVCELPD